MQQTVALAAEFDESDADLFVDLEDNEEEMETNEDVIKDETD